MTDGLRLDIDPPARGWAIVRLTAPGVVLGFTASCTPRDSIGDLASAAVRLLAGESDQIVVWNTEPVEYEFRFETAAGQTRLEVYEYPDARRHRRGVEIAIAVVETGTPAIARAVWRGLRRLQGTMPAGEFVDAWGHPFPITTVHRLGEELGAQVAPEPADPA